MPCQQPRRELPHRLQQAVARHAGGGSGQHERLVHQPGEHLKHVLGREVAARTDRLGRGEVPAAREGRQAAEEGPLVLAQQRVAPRQRGAQRLLAGRPGAVAAGQQAHAIVQPFEDLPQAERPDARRRQLQRQGDAVQPGADPGHRRGVLRRQSEVRVGGLSAFREEAHRRDARQVGERGEGGGVGHGERREAVLPLPGDAQRLAAGGEDVQPRRGGEPAGGEVGAGRDQVLAVVQHQQQRTRAQVGQHGRRGVDPQGQAEAQRGRDRRGQERGLGDGGQLDQPGTVGVARGEVGSDGACQAGLAAAAAAGEGDQRRGGERLGDRGALAPAPDQARALERQVVPCRRRRRRLIEGSLHAPSRRGPGIRPLSGGPSIAPPPPGGVAHGTVR